MGSSVEQIKERLSITDVVGSYIKLEKAGANFKARCPFHNEKTPSFFVSPDRGSFYCFGCGAKGDIFSFVEQFEGLDFVGTLKVLAERAGVELVRENPKTKNEKDRLYQVLDAATEFFEKSLSEDTGAKEYLAKRGVKEATIKNWRLGFALNEWRALSDTLLKKGFSADEMFRAGLIKKGDKGNYDGFRGRVMFPIFDSSDRVIGFSGRIMPALDDGKSGKYINSPETPLFNKSRVLYGLNRAKFDIRKRDYSIMVEGQMDLIMSHQAGFTNTVAASGTALSADIMSDQAVTNLGLLTRLSKNIILAFDSDEAGFKAAGRNAKIALSIGMDVKMAKINGGKDAADLILANSANWAEVIKNSKHIIDFSLDTLLEKNLEPRKLNKEIETLVLPYVAVLSSSIDQSHFIQKISKAAGIGEDALWSELKKLVSTDSAAAKPAEQKPNLVEAPPNFRRNSIERKVLGILYWQESQKTPSVDFQAIRVRLETILGKSGLETLEKSNELIRSDLIFEAEISYAKATNLKIEIEELLLNLEEEYAREKLAVAMKRLYGAEKAKTESEVVAALKTCQELSAKIAELRTKRKALDNAVN
jgi:DNA primase